MDTVQVAETFTSIQGESSYAGLPCFFIRLAGCNLRCTYCDTPQARQTGTPRRIPELVQACRDSAAPIAEVTGGEPLLQPATPALLAALHEATQRPVLLETNGSMDIACVPPEIVIVMDLKCPGSGHSDAMAWANLERLRPYDQVKFVLCDRTDYDWACGILRQYQLADRCQTVLFSPAAGQLDPGKLAGWLLDDRLPVRFQLQLHRMLGLM
ncbi:MAG: radical SAM protein [Kiritimatiellae bacterium]|nr:radical SAM protein [Kiritimatiellia bacterium]